MKDYIYFIFIGGFLALAVFMAYLIAKATRAIQASMPASTSLTVGVPVNDSQTVVATASPQNVAYGGQGGQGGQSSGSGSSNGGIGGLIDSVLHMFGPYTPPTSATPAETAPGNAWPKAIASYMMNPNTKTLDQWYEYYISIGFGA